MPDNKAFCHQNNDVHCVFRYRMAYNRHTLYALRTFCSPFGIISFRSMFEFWYTFCPMRYTDSDVRDFFLLPFSKILYAIVRYVFLQKRHAVTLWVCGKKHVIWSISSRPSRNPKKKILHSPRSSIYFTPWNCNSTFVKTSKQRRYINLTTTSKGRISHLFLGKKTLFWSPFKA